MNFTKKNKDELSYNAIVATKIIASALAGITESDAIFDIPETDEKSYLANCHTVKDFWSVSQYLNLKSQALYHFGLFEQAEAVIEEAKQYWNRARNYVREGDDYYDKVLKKLDYYQ